MAWLLHVAVVMSDQPVAKAPSISFAKASRDSPKGEDAACTLLPGAGAPAAFAIFDGHSGKQFAIKCSELICQRLMEVGPPFKSETIKDMMWAVDEEIGAQGVVDGATAQILLIEQAGDTFKGTLAWCGDSSAVVCDTSAASGTVLYATDSHTAGPDHQGGGGWTGEKMRLEFYRAVRDKLENNDTKPHDSLSDVTTREMVEEALGRVDKEVIKSLGKEVDEEEIEMLVKAFRRSTVIAKTFPFGKEVRKKMYVRQRSPTHDVNQVWVVATAEDRADPSYSDLQMTRSMGDWKASDLVLPEPQIHTFEVPADGIYRLVLASDGLWDVCSFEAACVHMKKASTVESCAKALLKIAEREYLDVRGHDMMDDDTTVLVIELNPAGVNYSAPQGAGCCTLQ